jgi:ferrous iron transport protein A
LRNLSQLKKNQSGKIKGFLDQELSVKMLEMGCLPGTEVCIELIAPLGDPIAISIEDYCLSIRREDAQKILIEE